MAANTVSYREFTPGMEYTDQEIINRIKNDLDRRVKFRERLNIMQDRLLSIIDLKLGMMFEQESFQDMRYYIDVSNNLARRIISELSVTYKDQPERTVSPKAGQKRYEALTNAFRIDSKMSKINTLLNGLNDLVLQVAVYGSKIDINIFEPDKIVAFENEDDPTVLDALVILQEYTDGQGKAQCNYHFWSPTRMFTLNTNYKRVMTPGQDGLNPYADQNRAMNSNGELEESNFYPFVFVHNSERTNSFWDKDSGNDLFEGTKLICIFNTFVAFMFPMQFKQLAVKMATDTGNVLKNNQVRSPLHVIQSNGDVTVMDWQSALTQLTETIDKKIVQIANNYGLSSENFKLVAQAVSGFSRMIAKERLLEIRGEQVKNFRYTEEEIFECVRVVNNTYIPGMAIPDSATFSIDFAEPKFPSDPLEELNVLDKKLQMGTLNLLDIVKQENPDIRTDEDALAFIQKNIDVRNMLKQRFNLSGIVDFTGAAATAASTSTSKDNPAPQG